ncbi:MAG: maleylpyruvate isomerase N-terminal domain-containing protein [Actinomycetota bacterium]|nr:maleylpyruvate isomerase N-terminal domain-containing protein [Actinomycetota bacterium]
MFTAQSAEDPVSVVSQYLEVAGIIRTFLATSEVAKYWEYPSELEEWTVAGLAGHLARPVLNIPTILAAKVPSELPLKSAVEYYSAMPASAQEINSQVAIDIRKRGVESAGTGAKDLLKRYDSALSELSTTLPELAEDHEVIALGARMLLTEYLITRMVEMVVHADDLAVSIGKVSPKFPMTASDTVVATLACISARRNSLTDVIRALAREERPIQRLSAF